MRTFADRGEAQNVKQEIGTGKIKMACLLPSPATTSERAGTGLGTLSARIDMPLSDQLSSLAALVQRMADESGASENFDARAWLDGWIYQEVPALGYKRPADVLREPGGLERVEQILPGMQSGAYF